MIEDSATKTPEMESIGDDRSRLLFIFHNPFLKTDSNCINVTCFHIVGKAKVDQMNEFHEVCVIARLRKAVAEDDRGDEHDP